MVFKTEATKSVKSESTLKYVSFTKRFTARSYSKAKHIISTLMHIISVDFSYRGGIDVETSE